MLNNTEDKVNKMITTPVTLFYNLTNNDLIAIHEAGELENFCYALTLDLALTFISTFLLSYCFLIFSFSILIFSFYFSLSTFF